MFTECSQDNLEDLIKKHPYHGVLFFTARCLCSLGKTDEAAAKTVHTTIREHSVSIREHSVSIRASFIGRLFHRSLLMLAASGGVVVAALQDPAGLVPEKDQRQQDAGV
jgi:hypothetical protein